MPTPKALLALAGSTLLQRSLAALAPHVDEIVVATPPDLPSGAAVAEVGALGVPVSFVPGGATRQESVRRALATLSDDLVGFVIVHDAARPLVPAAVVRRVVAALRAGATCVVPVVAPPDSLREVISGGANRPIDRSAIRLVQTPQGFTLDALRRAHGQAANALATDDATLAETVGEPVTLVEGDPLAFKITGPSDLAVAEALVAAGFGD